MKFLAKNELLSTVRINPEPLVLVRHSQYLIKVPSYLQAVSKAESLKNLTEE